MNNGMGTMKQRLLNHLQYLTMVCYSSTEEVTIIIELRIYTKTVSSALRLTSARSPSYPTGSTVAPSLTRPVLTFHLVP